MVETYTAFGAALTLQTCSDPEVLIEGPAGTGKSRAALEKVYAITRLYPGVRSLIARQTRSSMTESVLVTLEDEVMSPPDRKRCRGWRKTRSSYDFPNGSQIVLAGCDDWTRLMSGQYDLIYVPEATEIEQETWEALTTRLRNHRYWYQQIVGDCNPTYPNHWLNQRCLAGKTTRLKSRHADNPAVTPEYLATLANLTGHRRARLYLGEWVAAQSGELFRLEWLTLAPDAPQRLSALVRYWDLAASASERADYTVGVLMGREEIVTASGETTARYWVLDVQRGQWSPAERNLRIVETARADALIGSVRTWVEDAPGLAAETVAGIVASLSAFGGRSHRPHKSKAERADPLAAAAENGLLRILDRPWTPALRAELLNFPPAPGGHDDQVDACSGAFSMLSAPVRRGMVAF